MKKMGLNYYKDNEHQNNQQRLEKIPGQYRKFINKRTTIILDDEKCFEMFGVQYACKYCIFLK